MDDKQIQELLERQEKTHVLVLKLWRAEKWRRFWMIFKYMIYLGIIFGAFYFLNPYIERFIDLFQKLKDAQVPQDLQKLLEQLKK